MPVSGLKNVCDPGKADDCSTAREEKVARAQAFDYLLSDGILNSDGVPLPGTELGVCIPTEAIFNRVFALQLGY